MYSCGTFVRRYSYFFPIAHIFPAHVHLQSLMCVYACPRYDCLALCLRNLVLYFSKAHVAHFLECHFLVTFSGGSLLLTDIICWLLATHSLLIYRVTVMTFLYKCIGYRSAL